MNINKSQYFVKTSSKFVTTNKPAGTKLLKAIKSKSLTIRNKGGIVSDAIRQMSRDKNLAKLANK